ncbi:MAG: PilZ domain-containing protein [Acidobacteriaceae bacterium]|jgi:hypothetical protein
MGSDIREFVVRAARFDFRTPIIIYMPNGIARGHSVNLSESGMLVTLDRRVDVWDTGRLSTAATGERYFSVDVRVVRVEGRLAALTYKNVSESERATIQRVIEHMDPGLADRPLAPAS